MVKFYYYSIAALGRPWDPESGSWGAHDPRRALVDVESWILRFPKDFSRAIFRMALLKSFYGILGLTRHIARGTKESGFVFWLGECNSSFLVELYECIYIYNMVVANNTYHGSYPIPQRSLG